MRDVPVKILIAAGGSGGHIFPAVALARALKGRGGVTEIRFVGSNKILDRRIFEKEGFSFHVLSMNKMPYKRSFRFIPFFIKLKFDILKSFFIMITYKPDIVIGFGGYVSFPVIFSAFLLGIPRILHEQNVVPGRANRYLFKWASAIAISFEETKKVLDPYLGKTVFTGNPIRHEISSGLSGKDARRSCIERLGLDPEKFTMLVIGGSQGSHFLNETFIKAISVMNDEIIPHLQLIHITGLKDYEWSSKEYEKMGRPEAKVYSFIDKIDEAYGASDLVLTRSGASAIFELAFLAKPMILVPYPFAMSHQAQNAEVFAKNGAAIAIDENKISAGVFKDVISRLFNDRPRLNILGESARRLSVPEASENLAELVMKYAR